MRIYIRKWKRLATQIMVQGSTSVDGGIRVMKRKDFNDDLTDFNCEKKICRFISVWISQWRRLGMTNPANRHESHKYNCRGLDNPFAVAISVI